MRNLQRAFAILLALLASAFAIELCLRFTSVNTQRKAYVAFHHATEPLPLYTKILVPNQAITLPFESPHCDEATNEIWSPVRFCTDSDRELLPFRTEGDLVVFAGGSTTECFDVHEASRFPFLVGELLRSNFDLEVSTRNWGIRGHTTQDTLTVLIYRLRYLHPKLLVVMHNINDRSWLAHNDRYEATPETPLDGFEVLVHQLKQISTLGYYVLHRAQSHGLLSTRFPGDHRRADGSFFELGARHEAMFKENLCLLNSCASVLGTRLVLMTQPLREHDDSQQRFNQIIRDLGANFQIPVIDLESKLADRTQTSFFEDGIHLNECGCRATAELIAKDLAQLLKPPAPTPTPSSPR